MITIKIKITKASALISLSVRWSITSTLSVGRSAFELSTLNSQFKKLEVMGEGRRHKTEEAGRVPGLFVSLD